MYFVFSCTKAIVAAAVWLLFEEGLLKLEERVADIIPEFGTNGKDRITVEHVLLHTAGFPYAKYPIEDWPDRSRLLEAFARWTLEWEPDSRYEYHPTSAHWVLSEIIYRRTGIDYRDFIRQRVTGPIGIDEFFLGLPPELDARLTEVGFVGEPVEPPGGWRDVTPEHILQFNDPRCRRAGLPGGGGIASAAELALFYQVLVNGGETIDGKQDTEAGDHRFRHDCEDERPSSRAGARHSREPGAQHHGGRRRRERAPARVRQSRVSAGLRARRRRRTDRLGRPGDGDIRRLLHERVRRLDDVGAAHDGDIESGGELRDVGRCGRILREELPSRGSLGAEGRN